MYIARGWWGGLVWEGCGIVLGGGGAPGYKGTWEREHAPIWADRWTVGKGERAIRSLHWASTG